MPAPNIQIIFKQEGTTAIKRGERGIVALILKDSTHNGLLSMNSVNEIPSDLSTSNKTQIQFAFIGGTNPPEKVIAYIEPTAAIDYTDAMDNLETVQWNYIAVPGIATGDTITISSWIKGLRDNKDIKVKAVLPNTPGDHEGIINFATDSIAVDGTTYTAKDYCSRIAGLLAGTPLDMSATYSVLSEVDDVPHLTKADFDTAVDAGKLMLINDGTKVKVVRAVNSLTTTTADKGSDFKKIKIVDIMDQMHDDIKSTTADSYVGKVPNDYDHKCLLIAALRAYCESLEALELLDKGQSVIDIDTDAQINYLKSNGTDTSKLNDQEIRESNTGDQVFIGGSVKILDAMEDFNFNITL